MVSGQHSFLSTWINTSILWKFSFFQFLHQVFSVATLAVTISNPVAVSSLNASSQSIPMVQLPNTRARLLFTLSGQPFSTGQGQHLIPKAVSERHGQICTQEVTSWGIAAAAVPTTRVWEQRHTPTHITNQAEHLESTTNLQNILNCET